MRFTTLFSFCGLLVAAASASGISPNPHATPKLFKIAHTGQTLEARAPQDIEMKECSRGQTCEECWGDGFKNCPGTTEYCYNGEIKGAEKVCDYIDEIEDADSFEELEDLAEEIMDEVEKGDAARLDKQRLLLGAAVGAGVLMGVF